MGLTVFNGLPAHVLFVHFVVVLVPLTALAAVAGAVRPRWARRFGLVLPLLGLVTMGMVPVTTHAGEWLERRVDGGPLLHKHTQLGDTLLPWAIGLFVVCAGVWWLGRATPEPAAPGADRSPAGVLPWAATTWFRAVAILVTVVVAAGAVVDVYRIGESGAKAAWTGSYSSTPLPHKG
jgi:predicted ferric reductase